MVWLNFAEYDLRTYMPLRFSSYLTSGLTHPTQVRSDIQSRFLPDILELLDCCRVLWGFVAYRYNWDKLGSQDNEMYHLLLLSPLFSDDISIFTHPSPPHCFIPSLSAISIASFNSPSHVVQTVMTKLNAWKLSLKGLYRKFAFDE